jgi:hypothetical protein
MLLHLFIKQSLNGLAHIKVVSNNGNTSELYTFHFINTVLDHLPLPAVPPLLHGRVTYRWPRYCRFRNIVAYRPIATQGHRNKRDSGRCLVTASKHINNIGAITRQPPTKTREEQLGRCFLLCPSRAIKRGPQAS